MPILKLLLNIGCRLRTFSHFIVFLYLLSTDTVRFKIFFVFYNFLIFLSFLSFANFFVTFAFLCFEKSVTRFIFWILEFHFYYKKELKVISLRHERIYTN